MNVRTTRTPDGYRLCHNRCKVPTNKGPHMEVLFLFLCSFLWTVSTQFIKPVATMLSLNIRQCLLFQSPEDAVMSNDSDSDIDTISLWWIRIHLHDATHCSHLRITSHNLSLTNPFHSIPPLGLCQSLFMKFEAVSEAKECSGGLA